MNQHPEWLLATVFLPLLCGWAIARYLRPPLVTLLTRECGTDDRADFWSRLATVGMMVGPTALALMRAGAWNGQTDPVEIARALLSVSLNGVLAVLLVLAYTIWQRIPDRPGAAGAPGASS